jgi:hypothetical protein
MSRILVAALALALGTAGCGSSEKRPAPKAKTVRPVAKTPEQPADAGPAYADVAVPRSGGELAAQPHGKVVARSGFDLRKDGFAFRNYGPGTPQMRQQEVREIFGRRVCIDPEAATCTLTPEAERWRVMENDAVAGGHCYGFSSLALALRRGKASPADYHGGPNTFDLRIADASRQLGNPDLDADISRDAALQDVPGVRDRTLFLTPRQVIARLRRAFAAGDDNWVLGFIQPGVGGHAVVPTAIEDMGDGKFDIVLYDNNFPYIPEAPASSERRFHIDTDANRWDYTISIRPDVPEDQWGGTARGVPLILVNARSQSLPQPCPFCGGLGAAAEEPAPGETAPKTEIVLTGDAADHGRLRITDNDGNVTGWDGTAYVNEIPDAQIAQSFSIQRGLIDPEPRYFVPAGQTYEIELVDVPEGAPPGTVHVSGPGIGIGLSHLTDGGSTLTVGGGGAIAVEQAPEADVAPVLKAAVEGDRQVTIVPSGDEVHLTPKEGDDVKITGAVDSAVAKNPETGATEEVGSGTFDLSNAVGTTSSS